MNRARPLLVSGLVALLGLAACSSGGGSAADPPTTSRSVGSTASTGGPAPTGGPSTAATIATESGASASTNGVRIDITGLRRSDALMVVLTATVTNAGSKGMDYLALSSDNGPYRVPSATGVTLVDPTHRLRYFPLRDTDENCICTPFDVGDELAAGDSVPVTVSFPAPGRDVTAVTVAWTRFTPATDVPLS